MGTVLRGGGRFFWRNLGVTALTGSPSLIVGGVVYGVARAATRPLEDSLTEAGAWIARLRAAECSGRLRCSFWVLVLDFARLALVASDRKGVWRTWTSGLRFVLSHLVGTVGLWLVFGALVLAAAGRLPRRERRGPERNRDRASRSSSCSSSCSCCGEPRCAWGWSPGKWLLPTASGMRGLVVDPVPAFVPPMEDPVDLDLAPATARRTRPRRSPVSRRSPRWRQSTSAAGENETPTPQLPG